MQTFKSILFAVVIFAVVSGNAAFNVRLPSNIGILGQEQIGPITNYTCPANGAFPDENNCQYFITCWEEEAVLNRCTEDMLFDLRYMGCEFAKYVDCQERWRDPEFTPTETPPPTTTTVDPTAPTTPTTPGPNDTYTCTDDGAFPHDTRCEYYWLCYSGTAELHHCPLDYLFDLVYMGCNFPELTDCQERERPPGASSTISPPSPTTTRPTEGPTSPTDPGNTSTSGPTTAPPTRTTGATDFQCPEPNGSFADPKDCNGFYVCIENIPIHEYCPPELHFNPATGMCDWPEVVQCEI